MPAIAATVESLVTDIVTEVLIRFPIIAQRTKGAHYFHRDVGLVVNIRQCSRSYVDSVQIVSVHDCSLIELDLSEVTLKQPF